MPLIITDVRTVLLTGPCTNDRFLSEARKRRSAAFVEIHTNGSIIGLGETYQGYFCAELVPSIVEFFKPILVGQHVDESADPTAWIAQMWERMYFCGNFWCRVGLGAITLTALEAALWDMAGKLRKKPVYQLLGGTKFDKIPGYATGGPSNYPKSKLAEKVDYYQSLGFTGFKVGAGKFENGEFTLGGTTAQSNADFEADKIAFLREHCGRDTKILIDGHMGNSPAGTWTVEIAKAVAKALEPFDLFLFEEPLPYYDAAGYAELAASTNVPIAGGECLSAMPEWLEYLRRDSFDIAQPDASYVGGLGEFLKIAREFEKRGKKIATHAWGAGGSLMQNVHAGFASPNIAILEVAPDYADLHKRVIGDSFQMKNGYVLPPQTPGLGIELTDAVKKAFPFVPDSGEYNSVPGKILVD
jgi:L-alanine-DL-glutamate epimerase-like enolase superfamily enzyme